MSVKKPPVWVEVNEGNAKTFPPPFQRIEIVTRPRVLYAHSSEYVHCFGRRTGISEVTVYFGRFEEKRISLFNVVRWRLSV